VVLIIAVKKLSVRACYLFYY